MLCFGKACFVCVNLNWMDWVVVRALNVYFLCETLRQCASQVV